MRVKEKFELIYGTSGDVYNILPIRSGTLSAYKVDESSKKHLEGLVKIFSKVKTHQTSDFVNRNMNKVVPVNMDIYPLPGATTKSKNPVANLSIIASPIITDYSSADVFSLYLYSLALNHYIYNKHVPDTVEEHISAFIFSIFMKLFGKKAGLVGAYRSHIPKLQFLINLYVHNGMVGKPINDAFIKKTAASLYFDPSPMNLNFNFSSTREFLMAIKANNIIPISEHKFSTIIINYGGISSLPMFEDSARLFATLLAITVRGNGIFSPFWSKININIFNKLVFFGLKNLG